jgi:hypothetical protein
MTRPPDILAHLKRQETLSVGDRVLKTGGDYEAEGEVRAVLTKRDGTPRIVVEFDAPRGLLFIMRPDQAERLERAEPVSEPKPDWRLRVVRALLEEAMKETRSQ